MSDRCGMTGAMVDLRKLKDRAAELAAKGKLEKAADLLREALEVDSKDVATRQRLAEVLRRAGRLPEAIDAYRAVADRYARDGLLIKAIAISKTILELDPEHVAAQGALADLYARRAAADGRRAPVSCRPALPRPGPPAPPRAEAPDEGVVAIPLGPPPPPPAEPADAPPELLGVEPPASRALSRAPLPPASATSFARIVSAAESAVEAGIDEDVIVDAEPMEDASEIGVSGDEPLGPHAARPPARGEPSPPPGAAPQPPPRPPAARARPPVDPGLPRVPIFSDLSRDAFVALTRAMVLRRVDEGEHVLREGEGGTSFYVVASGKLAVSRRDERGDAVVVGRLGEGEFFGEMALLSGAPRAATVIAEEPSELLEFRADVLLGIAGRHPQLASSMRRFYRQRLLASAMAVSPIFRPFGKGDRKLIMERFRARGVSEGEIVIREGEPSDGLYVVLDAVVEVVKRKDASEVVVGRLRQGDLFGEMSCLRKSPASATIVVRRGGTLLRLPRAAFDEVVVSYPQILELVAELSDERAENLDAILTGHAEWTEDGLVVI